MCTVRNIAVSLSKGGVGKTTTAVNLAAGLSLVGKQVLLVDADTQGQVAQSLGVIPESGLADLIENCASPEQAIIEARPNLFLLAGGPSLLHTKRVIARQKSGGPLLMAKALRPLNGRFDYVIIDTSPGWDNLAINVMFYAQEILAPVHLESMAILGLINFMHRLKQIQQYRRQLSLSYVVPTALDRRIKQSDEILEQVRGPVGKLLCTPIRYNVKLSEAPGVGQHIFEYAPRSKGAVDYAELTNRVLEND
jgi:chromosome partitioning protein